jgi:hypothetical protein
MLARCALCQKTFTTERFGVLRCPHCGGDVLLQDPSAPAAGASAPPETRPPAPPAQQPPPVPGTPPPVPTPWSQPPPWHGQGAPPPPWGAPSPGWGPLPPGVVLPPASGPGESSPFARRERVGIASAFAQTWRLAALEPRRFFRFVRVDETLTAVLFGVICLTIGMWAQLVYAALVRGPAAGMLEEIMRRLPPGKVDPSLLERLAEQTSPNAILMQALFTPVLAFVAIYVVSAILHLLLLAVRGAHRGFSATVTVVGYAFGVFLLEALPACGGLVAVLWFGVVAIVGLAEAQRCGTGRATFAVLAPLLLAFTCSCALGMLAGSYFLGGGVDLPRGGTGL